MRFQATSLSVFVTAFAVSAGMLVFANPGFAQGTSIEEKELRAALEITRKQLAEAEARAADAENQRKELVGSLAEAVRVSEEQVLAAREVRLKLEAFGVDLFTQKENSFEQRLLKAVRDLDIARQENERLSRALHGLSESFLKYLQETTDTNPSAREQAQNAIAQSSEALSTAEAMEQAAGGLKDATIVSIDSEVGLVVINVGRAGGIRVGTPVAVLREDQPIFTAMVVDVRDSISGALFQDRLVEGESVRVGDKVQLLPNQLNF